MMTLKQKRRATGVFYGKSVFTQHPAEKKPFLFRKVS
jgi:hypothetical protein